MAARAADADSRSEMQTRLLEAYESFGRRKEVLGHHTRELSSDNQYGDELFIDSGMSQTTLMAVLHLISTRPDQNTIFVQTGDGVTLEQFRRHSETIARAGVGSHYDCIKLPAEHAQLLLDALQMHSTTSIKLTVPNNAAFLNLVASHPIVTAVHVVMTADKPEAVKSHQITRTRVTNLRVTAPSSLWSPVRLADCLLLRHPSTSLQLVNLDVANVRVENVLQEMPNLEILSISHCINVDSLPKAPNLKRLHLHLDSNQPVASIQQYPLLERAIFHNVLWKDIEAILDKSLSTLRHLVLGNCGSDCNVGSMLSKFTRLFELQLRRMPRVNLGRISDMPALSSLTIVKCPNFQLAGVEDSHSLQHLTIPGMDIPPEWLRAMERNAVH